MAEKGALKGTKEERPRAFRMPVLAATKGQPGKKPKRKKKKRQRTVATGLPG